MAETIEWDSPSRRDWKRTHVGIKGKTVVITGANGGIGEATALLLVRTDFVETVANPGMKAQLVASRDQFAVPPEAIARAIAFAIEQPADVDVNQIVVRPTAHS